MNNNPGLNKPVTFTFGDAERIGRVVKKSERERRGRKPSTLPRAALGGASVSYAVFTGSWQKGDFKSVLKWDPQQTTTNAEQVSVINLISTVDQHVANEQRFCVIADGDPSFLVSVECG